MVPEELFHINAPHEAALYYLCPALVSSIEGRDCREVMRSIAEGSVIPEEKLSHIVAGMYRVLTEAIRIPDSSLKQEVSCV